MTSFIGKSTHPVEVKKVFVKIWTLRDEIESAIAQRIEEEGHSEDKPVDIDDIKAFYHKHLNSDEQTDEDNSEEDDTNQNLDPSGNPMDDDAQAMMAAMGGGEDSSEEESSEEESSEDESSEDENSEEDDEAAKLAAEMLADQGGSDTPKAEEKPKQREPFERVRPDEKLIGQGYVLLADIVMDQMLLFCNKNYTIGQNLIVEFQVTKPFSVTAELTVSQDIARNSKIIKQIKYARRLQTVFLFQFPGERANLRKFLQSIEPEIPSPPKKLKRPESDSDDDDFDDLGF